MGEDEFKVGDIVELKSGSPPMTVSAVNVNLVGDVEIKCRWWCMKMESGAFSANVLKIGRARSFEELRSSFDTVVPKPPAAAQDSPAPAVSETAPPPAATAPDDDID